MRYLIAVILSLLLAICIVKLTGPIVEFLEERTETVKEMLE